MEVNSKPILVSVIMITYNHDRYIKKAIQGILMQIVDFEMELIIADDHSTDQTEAIVQQLINNHENGNRIKYTRHKANKGVYFNSIWAFQQAKGTYLAVCEGDDYWIDPLKLRKQVDFLAKNPDYSFCFHAVDIKNEITGKNHSEKPVESREYTIEELLVLNILHTVSFLFRTKYLNSRKSLSKIVFGIDGFIVLVMAENGKLFGMKDVMAVYRIHKLGISNSEPERIGIAHQKRFIKQYVYFKKSFKSVPKQAINTIIVDYCMVVAEYYLNKWNPKALFYLFLAIYYRPDLIFKGFKKIVK